MKRIRSAARVLLAATASVAVWSLLAWPIDAQEKPETRATTAATAQSEQPQAGTFPDGWVPRVYQIKNGEPGSIRQALRAFSGRSDFDRQARLVMWTGPKDLVPAVEELVRRLDVAPAPAPNVELVFYLLSGSRHDGAGQALPGDLEGVAKQLRNTFVLERLSLLETTVLRARAGSEGTLEGRIAGLGDAQDPARYTIGFDPLTVSADESGRVIRLAHLGLRLQVSVTTGSGESKRTASYRNDLNTDVEFREGQKVVVGKTSSDLSGDSLFLVVSGKIGD
jgi:hypothetical protein